MGGIRMKARGSTVDLIIADENPGINEVPNGPIPVDNNDGIPCFPMAKMFCDGTNILRKRQDVPVKGDREVDRRQLKRFSLKELRIATNDFSTNNILGRGGYGVVYKGRLADGSLVAVKRLERSGCQGESEFQNEVETSSMIVSHRNLLGLRGFCKTTTERLLVYPYMANSSVAWWLRGRPTSDPPLDWPTRKRIALGCARGLSYLHDHCDPKIIHRDVKPANILLNEEFEAVVVDFGLAILMDCTDTHIIVDSICGTFGYMPLEYCLDGMCSEKIDVFGYGIMLLELITGQRIYDHSRSANDVVLADWVKGMLKDKKLETVVVDLNLDYNYVEAEVEQLLQVALLCTQNSPMDRPRMSNVMTMLECDGLAEIWYERQKVEILRQLVFDLAFHPNSDSDWSDCSTEEAVELSGPM